MASSGVKGGWRKPEGHSNSMCQQCYKRKPSHYSWQFSNDLSTKLFYTEVITITTKTLNCPFN